MTSHTGAFTVKHRIRNSYIFRCSAPLTQRLHAEVVATNFPVLTASIVRVSTCSMTVSALSIFIAPPVWFFRFLQLLQFVPPLLITIVVCAALIVLSVAYLIDIICGQAGRFISRDKLPSCFESRRLQQVKSLGICLTEKVGRTLCPAMFPGLFTEHKMRTQAEASRKSVPTVYIVFLNRDLNDHCWIMPLFSLMSFAVLAASAMVFFNSFPLVITNSQCLEEDKNGHPLYCYEDNSPYPKNCTNSTNHVEANIVYTCYSRAIDIFGVASASAMGVFKFSIFFITAYIRMSEWCLTKSSRCVKCKWISIIVLIVIQSICVIGGDSYVLSTVMTVTTNFSFTSVLAILSMTVEYTYLPFWICMLLIFLAFNLEAHCNQEEFNTLSPDQLPSSSPLLQQER